MVELNGTRFWAVLAVLAVVLGGCSGGGGSSDVLTYLTPGNKVPERPLVAARYPERYKVQIADFMRRDLSNPGKVKDASISEPVLKPVGGSQPLYVTCVRYNPRDTRNQYEGNQTKFVIFLDGQISQILPENPDICRGLVYQRYPELESLGPP